MITKEHIEPIFEVIHVDESNSKFFAASGSELLKVGLNSMERKPIDL